MALLCLLTVVDGCVPQIEMILFRGRLPVNAAVIKLVLLGGIALSCLLQPRIRLGRLPFLTWFICVVYLLAEVWYLVVAWNMSIPDIIQSYNSYYVLLLIWPALLALRESVSESSIVKIIVFGFLICANIAVAQYLTGKPLLYTSSIDGGFQVQSWNFFGQVRAFSLFSSGLNFGIFCALCGALGVALTRKSPLKGILLCALSAVACFTTLTRLCYLVFACACISALVLAFGKKPGRGLVYPFVYAALGICTMFIGLASIATSDSSSLESGISLLDRLDQWIYYSGVLNHATIIHQLFGLGIVQNAKLSRLAPMVIDNVPLALILHIGVVGVAIVGLLLFQMWLYLRRLAISSRSPFAIAAASLWSTLICAGSFNIVLGSFGAIFALTVLCHSKKGDRGEEEANRRLATI